MRPRKPAGSGRRKAASPPGSDSPLDSPGFETVLQRGSRSRSSKVPASLLVDRQPALVTAEDDETLDGGGGGRGGGGERRGEVNPRSFPYNVKLQCWEKAEKVKGRDPERWRRDALGNIIFRKLVGCPGCLCHDYDHIIPFSKGGKSTLDNCQVLQATVNRSKGNKTEISKSELIQKSAYCRVAGRDMDLIELSAYGNVRRGQDSGGGCSIQ